MIPKRIGLDFIYLVSRSSRNIRMSFSILGKLDKLSEILTLYALATFKKCQ